MALGVFIHRPDSVYDDSPAEHYQFPRQYLRAAKACEGGWILYYEPTKVPETRGYFAVARVAGVVPDPAAAGMYLALIEPGSYLDFASPVPFTGPDGLVERGLLNAAGRISGRAQAAVRLIGPEDFGRILDLGLTDGAPILPRLDRPADMPVLDDPPVPFLHREDQPRLRVLASRVVRDRVFRRTVLRAYDQRCAVTGLRLINGGGRAEVEAAHIRPVEAGGPDTVANGLALSGTAHWMFDRGLISLDDDLRILVSRQTNDPDAVRAVVNRTGRALAPRRLAERPHPHFLRWHREHCFKN